MASKLVEVKTASGGTILMQISKAEGGIRPATSLDDAIDKVEATVQQGLKQLADIGRDFVSTLSTVGDKLETAELELGLSVTGKGKLFVVESEAEASLKAKLVYKFK
jgi:Trypsin-co-occurring domain 1